MKIQKRLEELESKVELTQFDSNTDKELTAWILEHPGFLSQQPEGREIVMPDHLSKAWHARIHRVTKKHGLESNLSDLLQVWDEIYP